MDINKANLGDLNTTYSAAFKGGLDIAPTNISAAFTMEVPSSGASNKYPFLGALRGFREWVGPRVFNQLASHTYTVDNKLWEDGFEMNRTEIEDDQFGLYIPIASGLGQEAQKQRDEVVFKLLENGGDEVGYDGFPFFDTAHPVGGGVQSNDLGGTGDAWYLMDTSHTVKPMVFQNRLPPEFVAKTSPNDEGVFMEDIFRWGARIRNNAGFGLWQLAVRSNQPLTEENYIAAKAALRGFKNDEGKPMGNRPTAIVVGGSNVDVALKLFSQTLVGGGDTNYLKFQGISIVEADRFLP